MALLPGPIRFVTWLGEHILEAVEAQCEAEEESVLAELAELNRRYDAGEIDEAYFEAREDELMDTLETLRAGGHEENA